MVERIDMFSSGEIPLIDLQTFTQAFMADPTNLVPLEELLHTPTAKDARPITEREILESKAFLAEQFSVLVDELTDVGAVLLARLLKDRGIQHRPRNIGVASPGDEALNRQLWPKSVGGTYVDRDGHTHDAGIWKDQLGGLGLLLQLLKPNSKLLTILPPNSFTMVERPHGAWEDIAKRLMANFMQFELNSPFLEEYMPENIARTKKLLAVKLELARIMGMPQMPVHLLFMRNLLIDKLHAQGNGSELLGFELSEDQKKELRFKTESVMLSGQSKGRINSPLERKVLGDLALKSLSKQIPIMGKLLAEQKYSNSPAVLHLGVVGEIMTDDEFAQALEYLPEVLQLAQQHGLQLVVETQGLSFTHYKLLLQNERLKGLKFCFDVAHVMIEAGKSNTWKDIWDLWKLLGNRIAHVHIAQTVVALIKGVAVHKDLHPYLSVNGGINFAVFQAIYAEGMQFNPPCTFTIEAPGNIEEMFDVAQAQRFAVPWEEQNYPLEAVFDNRTTLSKMEISENVINFLRELLDFYFADFDQRKSDRDVVASKWLNRLTNGAPHNLTRRERPVASIEADLEGVLTNFSKLIDTFGEQLIFFRHTSLLMMVVSEIQALRKDLQELQGSQEPGLTKRIKQIQQNIQKLSVVATQISDEINDVDFIVDSDDSATEIDAKIVKSGLKPVVKNGVTGTFSQGMLDQMEGEQVALLLSFDNGKYVMNGKIAEFMRDFAIPAYKKGKHFSLEMLAELFNIPMRIQVTLFDKSYTVLHPYLSIACYVFEALTLVRKPFSFYDFSLPAVKQEKAQTRALFAMILAGFVLPRIRQKQLLNRRARGTKA